MQLGKTVAMAVAMAIGVCVATAGTDTSKTGTVLLTLRGGIEQSGPEDRYTNDMDLELTLRDGKFDPKVWGWAVGLQKCDHEGEIVSADGGKLAIKMVLNRDAFMLRSGRNPLGRAEYEIEVKRDGDRYEGTFAGKIFRPAAGAAAANPASGDRQPAINSAEVLRAIMARGTNTAQPEVNVEPAPAAAPAAQAKEEVREVNGKVTGRIHPLWTEPPAGFRKLEPNEHPRLIFRKSDLPLIKKRLETPEGKAIMARFLEQLPKSHGDWPKVQMYLPAGYGLAYQLTGDKAHADKAREILGGMLGLGGSQDIHYGPMAQSMAVTLDFCYDAWDAEFRQKVIDNLARRMMNLETLTGMGGASLNPWHNHEAIRAAGAGVAAVCLLGEKTSNGKEIAGLERIIHVNARSIRRFFQYNGDSGSGWGLEGDAYKRMVWNSGPGHVVQACRSALGIDLVADGLGAWSILGEWMWLPPGDDVVQSEASRGFTNNGQRGGGFFILGLTTVPDSMKAGVRWLFDRSYGLQGDKTFNLLWAYHAAYLLMNYPFDVPAKVPTESLPWVAPDPTGGHWVFRKPWQGAQDTLVVLNPSLDNPGGSHWITGRSWDMQLFALGKLWIGDRRMDDKTGAPGAALPTTANPGAYTPNLGARLLGWNSTPDGLASLAWDNSPIYMSQLARGATPSPDQKLIRMSRLGQFVDHGIRATRYMAIDLSGASGAPVLIAILDQSKGAKDFAWNLKLAQAGAKVEGSTVISGDPAGANMRCTFIAPKAPTLAPSIKATGGEDYYAVITIQNGAAPEVKAEGDGLTAKVTVGKQAIRFDGVKFVFEK